SVRPSSIFVPQIAPASGYGLPPKQKSVSKHFYINYFHELQYSPDKPQYCSVGTEKKLGNRIPAPPTSGSTTQRKHDSFCHQADAAGHQPDPDAAQGRTRDSTVMCEATTREPDIPQRPITKTSAAS